MTVPVKYRKSAEAVFTVDFFDAIIGAGFINFYPAVGFVGATEQFFLTADVNVVSDTIGYRQDGNNDFDFDLLVDIPFTIANRECTINWTGKGDGVNNFVVTWHIIHVAVGGSETDIGTVISNNLDSSNVERKLSRVILTHKSFSKGEKLRVNAVITLAGANSRIFFDPAGAEPLTDGTNRGVTSNCTVQIPIRIPR